ncbi:M28 family metallopeptidase [Phenylobacterium koreense]|uniref:Zn-dependent M28 family amino/carboxypeptidase n=1 Tax=Phenylobacterium koreense TaxID=266125 RepID=A0ABV2EKD2_9CAUL
MKKFLLAGAAICAVFSSPALAGDISPAKIAEHVKVLSDDSFEGRAPATEGEKKTVAYIAEQYKAAGLQPGGDLVNGQRAWTQDVPLARFENKGPLAISATFGGKTESWSQGEEVALRAAQTGVTHVSIKDAPIVFVGYGVTAPERNWDDFKGVDLKGKVALVLVNDPDFETGRGDFGGKAMTYYGRWTYKYEEAARHQGAIGFLVIHETAPAAYGWATVKNSNTAPVFDIIRDNPSEAHALLEGWIQRDKTVELFKASGLDFEALKKQAQTRAFKPVELKGATFSADFAVDAQKIVSKNVVGIVPGAKRPNETIIYSSHWDHLGVGLPDAKGDRIYNGAVDNADGIATMIEIGRSFAKGPKPERSVVFLAVTAEEKGLLGSEYYAANPLYPLATTVADINMDALSPSGPAKDFTSSGDAASTLQDALVAVGKAQGRSYSPDPRPEAGSFFRSDHFPFAKRGVPAISFGSGRDLVNGGTAAGDAFSKTYTADRYHQPADQFDATWNLDGIAQDGQLMLDLGRQLANSATWPEWKEGSEFKQTRDATAAERK